MQLDVPTLMVAGAFVALMSGALLLFAWYQYRETAAALWWAAADFVLAAGIVLIAVGSGSGVVLIFVAGLTCICASAALTFAGAREFDGRAVSWLVVALGPAAWIAAQALPVWLLQSAGAALNSAIAVPYYAVAALTVWRGRGEALRARVPLVVLVSAHALTLLIAVPSSLTGALALNQTPPVLSWFGLIHFETMIFAIGTAIFMVAMMKERSESRHLETSQTDALTGMPNRRGFFARAQRVLERCRCGNLPVAVVVFDLDRFKSVNDGFGHAMGDRALQTFATVCEKTLRPSDVLGRLGGEEFVALLAGSGIEAGYAMGERVRKAFAEAAAFIDGSPVGCTVSAGVAAGAAPGNVEVLLRQADAGLYQAKSLGRNRVELSPDLDRAAAKVIRVA